MPKSAAWLLKVVAILFLIYAAVNIVILRKQIAQKQEQLDTLEVRVQEYQSSNDALQKEMQNGVSDDDLGELARTELGYAAPGERIFVDTSGKQP